MKFEVMEVFTHVKRVQDLSCLTPYDFEYTLISTNNYLKAKEVLDKGIPTLKITNNGIDVVEFILLKINDKGVICDVELNGLRFLLKVDGDEKQMVFMSFDECKRYVKEELGYDEGYTIKSGGEILEMYIRK